MKEQGDALAQHLKLTDGKSGYVEVTATGFLVHIRKRLLSGSGVVAGTSRDQAGDESVK